MNSHNMTKFILGIFAVIVLVIYNSASCLAQPGVELQGLSAKEVVQHFGPPDQKQKTSSGKETWSYGRSIILFRDGKISAWSDAGELAKRIKLAKLSNKDRRATQEREHWKNPWTTQKPLSNKQLLYQLLEESKSTDLLPTNSPAKQADSESADDKATQTKMGYSKPSSVKSPVPN